jgi:hypothetical protein
MHLRNRADHERVESGIAMIASDDRARCYVPAAINFMTSVRSEVAARKRA